MRQYPIWNEINSCIYSNYNKRSGNKSYGVKEHSVIKMKVGTSKQNSFDFATIKQSVRKNDDGTLTFKLKVDDGDSLMDQVILEGTYNTKDKTIKVTPKVVQVL